MSRRNKIPHHLRDTSVWPGPEALQERALETSSSYGRSKRSVEMYSSDSTYEEILKATGKQERSVRYLVDRCLETNPETGEIYGFHACVEGFRPRSYVRKAQFAANTGRGGASGMLGTTLAAFPNIEKRLISEALMRDEKNQHFAIPHDQLLAIFHDELKAAFGALNMNWQLHWPFTQQDQGYESLRKWRHKLLLKHPKEYIKAHSGKNAAKKVDAGSHIAGLFEGMRQLSVRILDFHEVDTACTLIFRDPNGAEFERVVERFHLGAIVTDNPFAIVGYVFVYEPSPNSDHVMDLMFASTFPEPRAGPTASLLPNGSVVLTGMVKELYGSGFAVLMMDNATYNVCASAVMPIMDALGCMVVLGAPGKWWSRPMVERFFGIYERKTNVVLPTTWGKSPMDPLRGDPIEAARRLKIRVDDILETFETFAEEFNSRYVSSTMHGQTAVNAVKAILANKPLGVFPQPLPVSPSEPGWTFFAEVFECNVCGNEENGTACYINLDKRTYSSKQLVHRYDLVGKALIVCRHRWDDGTVVAIVKGNPSDFIGFLKPDRRARETPMFPRLAKVINRFAKKEWFAAIGKSPGQQLLEDKVEAARKTSPRKKSREALDVLKLLELAQKAAEAPPSPQASEVADPLVEASNDEMIAPDEALPQQLATTPEPRVKVTVNSLARFIRNARRS